MTTTKYPQALKELRELKDAAEKLDRFLFTDLMDADMAYKTKVVDGIIQLNIAIDELFIKLHE